MLVIDLSKVLIPFNLKVSILTRLPHDRCTDIISVGWDRADTGAYYGDHEVIEDEDGAVIYVAPRSGNHNPDEYKDFTAYSNYLGQPQYGDEPGVIRDSDGNVVYRGDIEHDPAFYDDNYYDVPTWTQQTFRGSGSGSNETPIYQNADGEIVHIDDPDDAYLFHGNFVWPDQGVDDITQGVSQLPTQVAESSSDDNDGDLDHSRRGSARSAAAATQRQARPRRPNRVRTAAFSSTGRRMTRSRSSAEDESSHGGSGRSAGGSSATSSAIVPYDSLDNDPYAGRY